MFNTEGVITNYDVVFRMTSHYSDPYFDKSAVIQERYAADSYEAVVHTISDDIDNENFDFSPVLSTETTETPIAVEVEYVQIVNEYGIPQYIDGEHI